MWLEHAARHSKTQNNCRMFVLHCSGHRCSTRVPRWPEKSPTSMNRMNKKEGSIQVYFPYRFVARYSVKRSRVRRARNTPQCSTDLQGRCKESHHSSCFMQALLATDSDESIASVFVGAPYGNRHIKNIHRSRQVPSFGSHSQASP